MDPHGKVSGGPPVCSVPTVYTGQSETKKEKLPKQPEPLPEQPWGDLLNNKFYHLLGSFKENTIKVYESSPSRTMRLVAAFAALLLLAAVISLVIAQRDQTLHNKFRLGFPLKEITVTERSFHALPSMPQQLQASAPTVLTKNLDESKMDRLNRVTDNSALGSVATSKSNGPNDGISNNLEQNEPLLKKNLAATIVITAGQPTDDSEDLHSLDEDMPENLISEQQRSRLRFLSRFGPSTVPMHPRLMLIERLMGMQSNHLSSQGQSMIMFANGGSRASPSSENSNKLDEQSDNLDGSANVRIFIHGSSASPANPETNDDQRTRPVDRLQQLEKNILERAATQPPASMEEAPMLLRYAAASMLSRLVAAAAASASNQSPRIETFSDSLLKSAETSENEDLNEPLELPAEQTFQRIARFRPESDSDSDEETVPVLLATVAQHVHPGPQSNSFSRSVASPRSSSSHQYGRSPFSSHIRPPLSSTYRGNPSMLEARESAQNQPVVVLLAVPMTGSSDASPAQPVQVPPPSFAPGYYGPYSPAMMRSLQWIQRYPIPPQYPMPYFSGPVSRPINHYGPPPPYTMPQNLYGPPHYQPPYQPSFHHVPNNPAQNSYSALATHYYPINAAGPQPSPLPNPFVKPITTMRANPQVFGQPVSNQQDDQPEAEQHMIVLYDADSTPASGPYDTNDRDQDDSSVSLPARQALQQLIAVAANAARQRQPQISRPMPWRPPSISQPIASSIRPPINPPVPAQLTGKPMPINLPPVQMNNNNRNNNLQINERQQLLSPVMPQLPIRLPLEPSIIRQPPEQSSITLGRPVEFSPKIESSANQKQAKPLLVNNVVQTNSGVQQPQNSRTTLEQSSVESSPTIQPMLGQPSPVRSQTPLVAPMRVESSDESIDESNDSEMPQFMDFAQIIRSVVEHQHQQEQQQSQQQQSESSDSKQPMVQKTPTRTEQPITSTTTNTKTESETPDTESNNGSTVESTSPELTESIERESKNSKNVQPIAQESIRRPAFIVMAEQDESK